MKDPAKHSVLVYQMGKVGSKSIAQALATFGMRPYHVHNIMDPEGEYVLSRNLKLKDLPDRLKSIRIVSPIREPLARNLSAFVHGLDRESYKEYPTYQPRTLLNLFVRRYNHNFCLEWMEKELIPFSDINVYKYPFNTKAGYTIIEKGKISVLILRLDKLEEITPEAFTDFFGITSLNIDKVNPARYWWYPRFKDYIRGRLPDKLLERLYESTFTRHFFAPHEIRRLYAYWQTLA